MLHAEEAIEALLRDLASGFGIPAPPRRFFAISDAGCVRGSTISLRLLGATIASAGAVEAVEAGGENNPRGWSGG